MLVESLIKNWFFYSNLRFQWLHRINCDFALNVDSKLTVWLAFSLSLSFCSSTWVTEMSTRWQRKPFIKLLGQHLNDDDHIAVNSFCVLFLRWDSTFYFEHRTYSICINRLTNTNSSHGECCYCYCCDVIFHIHFPQMYRICVLCDIAMYGCKRGFELDFKVDIWFSIHYSNIQFFLNFQLISKKNQTFNGVFQTMREIYKWTNNTTTTPTWSPRK